MSPNEGFFLCFFPLPHFYGMCTGSEKVSLGECLPALWFYLKGCPITHLYAPCPPPRPLKNNYLFFVKIVLHRDTEVSSGSRRMVPKMVAVCKGTPTKCALTCWPVHIKNFREEVLNKDCSGVVVTTSIKLRKETASVCKSSNNS